MTKHFAHHFIQLVIQLSFSMLLNQPRGREGAFRSIVCPQLCILIIRYRTIKDYLVLSFLFGTIVFSTYLVEDHRLTFLMPINGVCNAAFSSIVRDIIAKFSCGKAPRSPIDAFMVLQKAFSCVSNKHLSEFRIGYRTHLAF